MKTQDTEGADFSSGVWHTVGVQGRDAPSPAPSFGSVNGARPFPLLFGDLQE